MEGHGIWLVFKVAQHTMCHFVAITAFILVFMVRHYTMGCVLGKGGRGRAGLF